MVMLKKLIFAPIFLIVFTILIYQLNPFLKSYDLIFSLSLDVLIKLIVIAVMVFISSYLFTLFICLASDWRISLPVGILAALIPFSLIPPSLALMFAVGIFISLLLTFLSLTSSLKSYLTFNPAALLGPSIKHLSTLFILSFCLIYFFSVTKIIALNGFELPDSLIDTALKVTPTNLSDNSTLSQLPAIEPKQLKLLKQNPALLQQYGLDPKMLDSLNSTTAQPVQQMGNDLIKQTVKNQVQTFIKPFINFIPALLAILLFFTIQSFVSFINLLIYPLLWFVFFTLEKTGFVKFEVEQRPVKKLVV